MLNLANILDQVGRDKGINKEVLIDALESAMLKAAEKRFGSTKMIEAQYNEEMGEIELFLFKTVVEDIEDEDLHITLEAAKEFDPEAALDDEIGVKLDAAELDVSTPRPPSRSSSKR